MNTKQIILTNKAPLPIGPYSQAVFIHNTLYVSGQIPINPATGEVIQSGIENETKQVMENIQALIEAAGLAMENIVKTSIFLTNMNDFGKVNAIYGAYFQENPPARETIQIAALPKNVNVEISVIAVK
jgi:2-iminobutanoate/2-iminopropanoate deaminase